MCYEVTCRGCGHATFGGCGRHVAAVRLEGHLFKKKNGKCWKGCFARLLSLLGVLDQCARCERSEIVLCRQGAPSSDAPKHAYAGEGGSSPGWAAVVYLRGGETQDEAFYASLLFLVLIRCSLRDPSGCEEQQLCDSLDQETRRRIQA
jgi:hypothetical protein